MFKFSISKNFICKAKNLGLFISADLLIAKIVVSVELDGVGQFPDALVGELIDFLLITVVFHVAVSCGDDDI